MGFISDTFGGSSLSPGTLTSLFDPLDFLGTKSGPEAKKAAEEAAEAQRSASERGISEERRQFDITQANLTPFLEAGTGALGAQQALLGLSGADEQQAAFEGLETSPGQKFLRDRAQRNLVRNAGAIGGLGGGNVRSALVEQGVGFAQQDIQNQFGRLGQLAGQGQATGATLGRLGAQSASNIRQGILAGGEARASGILGVQQAGAQQTQGAQQAGLTALSAIFSDERLKYDIKQVDSDKDGAIYLFKYLGSAVEYIGRMAQDLMKARPDAVSVHESGYYVVTQEFRPEAI